MAAAGIIAEYNPLHLGHCCQLRRLRALLGEETPVICAMSGNFVQRGDFALLGKHARAEAAVRSGADLVLEIPLSWACAPAERFAQGGVEVLLGTGLVTDLVFGSESADAGAIRSATEALLGPDFPEALRRELAGPHSFAAARQRALAGLIGEEGAEVLSRPNDILAVEYAKALSREGSEVHLVPILRQGAGHDQDGGEYPSAGSIRRMIQEGRRAEALAAMAPAMRELYEAEEARGRAPVFAAGAERAILAQLRRMGEADFLALDAGGEGLGNRLAAAAREAASLEEVLDRAKTKRYAYSRLRRLALWAYLGLRPETLPARVPYLRPLAMNQRGRALLAEARRRAALPILTKPADVRRLSPEAQAVFRREVLATDLYTLAFPGDPAPGGAEWREGPRVL
ncbi:MAG: nucleotidyltransferase family protein [Dysosmobacter sp.]|nr:nucleotidyltransferase family protein [Dysosmobacter sp.]